MSNENKYQRKSEVKRKIISFLYFERETFTIGSLSKKLGIPYSSVNHIIGMLKDDGYVTYKLDNETGKKGRPGYLYQLTKESEILKEIEDFLGLNRTAGNVSSTNNTPQSLSLDRARKKAQQYLEAVLVRK